MSHNQFTKDIDYDHDVIIIGGGVVGLACAVGLERRGITNVCVYEKARSLKPIGAALSLYPNGYSAIKELLSPKTFANMKASCVPNQCDMVKDSKGEVIEIKTRNKMKIGRQLPDYIVRYIFHEYMWKELPENIIRLGCVLKSFSVNDATGLVKVRVTKRDGSGTEEKTCRVLIGADGIRSEVRKQLFGNRLFVYHGCMAFRAVVDMSALDGVECPPAGVSTTYLGKEKGKTFTFRETAKDVITIIGTNAMDMPTFSSTDKEKKKKLQNTFKKFPTEVRRLCANVLSSMIHEDGIYSINPEERWSKGPVVIVGDAAHAMPPALEQGANTGLEDACELVHALVPLLSQKGTEDGSANSFIASQIQIFETLEQFWKKRIDRVKEIYDRSDTTNRQKNKISAKEKIGDVYAFCDLDQDFLKRLYDWKPSYLATNVGIRQQILGLFHGRFLDQFRLSHERPPRKNKNPFGLAA